MHNSIWRKLYEEATSLVKTEPLLASYVYACILNHNSMGSALSFLLANKLSDEVPVNPGSSAGAFPLEKQ